MKRYIVKLTVMEDNTLVPNYTIAKIKIKSKHKLFMVKRRITNTIIDKFTRQ